MGQQQSNENDTFVEDKQINEGAVNTTKDVVDNEDRVLVLDTNDSDKVIVMKLEAKKQALNNTIFRLNKAISDKKSKICRMDDDIEKKKVEIKQFTENLNALKTEYFRLKDTVGEFKYNSRNKLRYSNSSLNSSN